MRKDIFKTIAAAMAAALMISGCGPQEKAGAIDEAVAEETTENIPDAPETKDPEPEENTKSETTEEKTTDAEPTKEENTDEEKKCEIILESNSNMLGATVKSSVYRYKDLLVSERRKVVEEELKNTTDLDDQLILLNQIKRLDGLRQKFNDELGIVVAR